MSDDRITDRPAAPPGAPTAQGPRPEEIYQTVVATLLFAFLGLIGGQCLGRGGSVFLALIGAVFGGGVVWSLVVSGRPRGVRLRSEALPTGERPRPAALPASTAIATAPTLKPRIDRVGGHRRGISGLALSPDGGHLASCDDEGAVIVHDLTTGFEAWAARDFRAGAGDLAYSPDGRLLAVCGDEQSLGKQQFLRTGVRVYDAVNGRELRRLEFSHPAGPVAFLPDRRLLVGVSVRVAIWELETPSEQRVMPSAPFSYFNIDDVVALAVRDDFIIVGCRHTQKARVVAMDRGEEVLSFEGHYRFFALVRVGSVGAVAVSPSGHHVLSGGLDGYARVWALRSGAEVTRFGGHFGWWGWHGVTGVGWLSDDEAVSAGEDGTLRRWDAQTGREIACFRHGRAIRRLALVGRTAVTGASDGSIRLWAV
jgi:WD40 repeat protein